jgi:phage baseplate assembly protein W
MASNHNSLSKFFESSVGGKTRLGDYIPVISSKGDFNKISDLSVILNSWSNILSTPRGTYTNNPQYGSELYKYVFDQADERTIEKIRNEIKMSLSRYDDRAVIKNIKIVFFSNMKGFLVEIEVDYRGDRGVVKLPFSESQLTMI